MACSPLWFLQCLVFSDWVPCTLSAREEGIEEERRGKGRMVLFVLLLCPRWMLRFHEHYSFFNSSLSPSPHTVGFSEFVVCFSPDSNELQGEN